jgi:chemotaxis family two-component system response regulator Rcp1
LCAFVRCNNKNYLSKCGGDLYCRRTGGALTRPYRILLVEDHLPDILLIRRVLQPSDDVRLVVVRDGITAMQYLHQLPPYESAKRPDLILLDLNLPRKDGREVLVEIKTDPGLRRIPVLILTASTDRSDVEHAYSNHANSYLRKPVGLEGLRTLVESIREFWMETALSPWNSDEVAEA